MAYSSFRQVLPAGSPRDIYLIEGDGLQFLLAGNKQGEAVLYVTLSESKIELQRRPADLRRDYVGGPSAEHAGLRNGQVAPCSVECIKWSTALGGAGRQRRM